MLLFQQNQHQMLRTRSNSVFLCSRRHPPHRGSPEKDGLQGSSVQFLGLNLGLKVSGAPTSPWKPVTLREVSSFTGPAQKGGLGLPHWGSEGKRSGTEKHWNRGRSMCPETSVLIPHPSPCPPLPRGTRALLSVICHVSPGHRGAPGQGQPPSAVQPTAHQGAPRSQSGAPKPQTLCCVRVDPLCSQAAAPG